MDKFYGSYNGRNGNGYSYGKNCSDDCSNGNRSRNSAEAANNGNRGKSYAEAANNANRSRNYADANDNGSRSRNCDENNGDNGCSAEFHLHEVLGSVQVADEGCEIHNHRFATVSSEPITLKNGDHAHQVTFRTDSYDGHCHEFTGRTTDAYEICEGHVHYLAGKTTEQAGHCHEFKVITHIENPTED